MKGFGFADTNLHIFFFIDDELAGLFRHDKLFPFLCTEVLRN